MNFQKSDYQLAKLAEKPKVLVKSVNLVNDLSLQTSDFSRRNRTMSEPKRKSKSGKKILSEESDSDSARSRSLSAGRTQGRGEVRKRATTPSKCKPNHSDPESSDDFTDSVSERVRRRRRVRRIREKAEAQKASERKTQNLEPIDSVDEDTNSKEICSETNSRDTTQNLGSKKAFSGLFQNFFYVFCEYCRHFSGP